jgi:hypothetical protein
VRRKIRGIQAVLSTPVVQQRPPDLAHPAVLSAIPTGERNDFKRANETLEERVWRIIRFWLGLHMILATLALLAILYHGSMELLINVFHVLPAV